MFLETSLQLPVVAYPCIGAYRHSGENQRRSKYEHFCCRNHIPHLPYQEEQWIEFSSIIEVNVSYMAAIFYFKLE